MDEPHEWLAWGGGAAGAFLLAVAANYASYAHQHLPRSMRQNRVPRCGLVSPEPDRFRFQPFGGLPCSIGIMQARKPRHV